MRKLFTSVILALALAIPLTVVVTGCTTTQQRKTVNTLFTLGQTVDAAYKSYLDMVVTGKLPTNNVPSVSARYSEFQTAFNAAVTLSTMQTNAPPSPVVQAAAANVLSAVKLSKGK